MVTIVREKIVILFIHVIRSTANKCLNSRPKLAHKCATILPKNNFVLASNADSYTGYPELKIREQELSYTLKKKTTK